MVIMLTGRQVERCVLFALPSRFDRFNSRWTVAGMSFFDLFATCSMLSGWRSSPSMLSPHVANGKKCDICDIGDLGGLAVIAFR